MGAICIGTICIGVAWTGVTGIATYLWCFQWPNTGGATIRTPRQPQTIREILSIDHHPSSMKTGGAIETGRPLIPRRSTLSFAIYLVFGGEQTLQAPQGDNFLS